MHPRLSLITLGTRDLAASRRFYEALGFVASRASQDEVAFFQLSGGLVLALHPRSLLAADAGLGDGGDPGTFGDRMFGDRQFGGITLAHNVRSDAEVDAVMAEAARVGARILKPAAKAFWGGYHGYFADPDGYPWEVAWNPHFATDASGGLALP